MAPSRDDRGAQATTCSAAGDDEADGLNLRCEAAGGLFTALAHLVRASVAITMLLPAAAAAAWRVHKHCTCDRVSQLLYTARRPNGATGFLDPAASPPPPPLPSVAQCRFLAWASSRSSAATRSMRLGMVGGLAVSAALSGVMLLACSRCSMKKLSGSAGFCL